MAVTASVLAAGSMPSSLTTVYTVPGSTKAVVTYASFHNTTGGAIDVAMYFNNGADVQVFGFSLGANETFIFKEKPVLATGYLIKLEASSGSSVAYWISGGLIT